MRFFILALLSSMVANAAGPIGASYFNLKQIATPSAPASGYNNLYFKSDSPPYYQTSSGSEFLIGSVNTVGTIDSVTASTNGLVISGVSIFAQSASSTRPGLVNNSTQQFSGVKTFVSAPVMSALTASEIVATDSGKALTSISYAFPPNGSTIPIRDSNGNLAGNVLIRNTATVVSAGGTTSMNGGSAQVQKLTGTSNQNFTLPDATTLISGWTYDFNNSSTGSLVIKNNGGTTLYTAVAGAYATVILTDNSTANGSWDIHWSMPTSASYGTAGLTVTGTITATSSITGNYFSTDTANPASAGQLRLAKSDLIEWRNNANSGNVTLSLSSADVIAASGNISATAFISTNTGSPATAGGVRLGNTEAINWRNAAASGNLPLTVNSSDQLTFNSNRVFDLGQTLSTANGGTGQNFSASTGAILVSSGTMSAGTVSTTYGGTGQNFSASTGAVILTSGTMSAGSIAGNLNIVKAVTVQKFTGGSGTYTLPTNPTPAYIRVRMVGGGGGGAGSGTGGGSTDATAGGNTTFGTALLSADGGSAGNSYTGGSGGSASLGTGPVGLAFLGAAGNSGGWGNGSTGSAYAGGSGGSSPFGGAGNGTNTLVVSSQAGGAAKANTGSGGGGGGTDRSANLASGGGGGAGGYVDAIITSPAATYSYAVGAAGSAGTAGSGGSSVGAGGNGAAGIIIVEEYYQ